MHERVLFRLQQLRSHVALTLWRLCAGTRNYMERYRQSIRRVSNTFGPIPTFDGETLDNINKVKEARGTRHVLWCASDRTAVILNFAHIVDWSKMGLWCCCIELPLSAYSCSFLGVVVYLRSINCSHVFEQSLLLLLSSRTSTLQDVIPFLLHWQEIHQDICASSQSLEGRRRWRDDRLAGLARLKKEMNEKTEAWACSAPCSCQNNCGPIFHLLPCRQQSCFRQLLSRKGRPVHFRAFIWRTICCHMACSWSCHCLVRAPAENPPGSGY